MENIMEMVRCANLTEPSTQTITSADMENKKTKHIEKESQKKSEKRMFPIWVKFYFDS